VDDVKWEQNVTECNGSRSHRRRFYGTDGFSLSACGHYENNNKRFEVSWAMGILILLFYLSLVVTGSLEEPVALYLQAIAYGAISQKTGI
jgi:hypothetical protein